MRDVLIRKGLVVGIIILFIGMSVVPSTGTVLRPSNLPISNDGKTLYVGGNGTGNYSKIQDAIDNASDGDTVFVYDDSSPYFENVYIDERINLIGEDKNSTIIDGYESGTVVTILADNVTISGFTIQNCGNLWYAAGVDIRSDFNTISKNVIKSNFKGISIWDSSCNSLLENNIVSSNFGEAGIVIKRYSNNTVIDNDVYSNYGAGILINGQFNPELCNNIISNNNLKNVFNRGIAIEKCYNVLVENNSIENSLHTGIRIGNSENNTIRRNTVSYVDIDGGILLCDYSHNNLIYENSLIYNIYNKVNLTFIPLASDEIHNLHYIFLCFP